MTHERPNRTIVFSGHMIDAVDRSRPRFPPEIEPEAAFAIDAMLNELGVGAETLGITEGACGGDLLFAEAMLARGAPVELYLPFERRRFLRASVAYRKIPSSVADRWAQRFFRLLAHPSVRCVEMDANRDQAAADANPYARCNLRMIDEAIRHSGGELELVCLWDGIDGDLGGGTAHMVEAVQRRGGRIHWIDIRPLLDARETAAGRADHSAPKGE
ncbi:MAG: hypothetical protein R3F45_11345 [Gammaproteobacteria bacterium]